MDFLFQRHQGRLLSPSSLVHQLSQRLLPESLGLCLEAPSDHRHPEDFHLHSLVCRKHQVFRKHQVGLVYQKLHLSPLHSVQVVPPDLRGLPDHWDQVDQEGLLAPVDQADR